jgi:uncharacterized lipoprotein YajG
MKFRQLFISVATVILLIGCATPRPLPPVSLSDPDASEREVLTRAVLASLKDPDSAMFRDMTLVDHKAACVAVNAKNAFGGYPGYQQAMLTNIDGVGWQVLAIENVSRDVCVKALHSTINK